MDEFMNNIFSPENRTSMKIHNIWLEFLAALVEVYADSLPHADVYAAGQNSSYIEELEKYYVRAIEKLIENNPLDDRDSDQYHEDRLNEPREALVDHSYCHFQPFASDATITRSSYNFTAQVNTRKNYFAEENRGAYTEHRSRVLMGAAGVRFAAGAIAGGIAGAKLGVRLGMLDGGHLGGPVPAVVGFIVGGVVGYICARVIPRWSRRFSGFIGGHKRPLLKKKMLECS